MKTLFVKLRRRTLGLSPKSVSFKQRGFRGASAPICQRLETVGTAFLSGYHFALESVSTSDLETRLNGVELELRGFAFEGAAMGLALATRGDKDPAIQQFNQAIQITPGDPMLSYTYAVWLNKWHVRGAAPLLDAALPLVKNDFPMMVSIGHEYRLAGEFDSCVRTFDAAVKTRDGGEVRTERALCKLGLKDEAGTLADLKSAVTTEPGYAQAHFFLAGRLASTKHFKDAVLEYGTYLQLAPNGSLADQASERLKAAQDAADHEKQDKGVAVTPKKKPK